MIASVLVTLTFATLFGLIPLYGTKVVFDYVLTDQPVPDAWRQWINLPTGRGMLLQWVALAMISFSLVSLMLGIGVDGMRRASPSGYRSVCGGTCLNMPSGCRCIASMN